MPRLFAAAVLALHGLVHLIGFVVPWRVAAVEGFPYRTTALNDAVTLGDAGARLVGLGWLAVAVGFVVAALGVARRRRWSLPLALVLAAASAVLCVLGLPEAAAGIAVDGVILGATIYLLRRTEGVARP